MENASKDLEEHNNIVNFKSSTINKTTILEERRKRRAKSQREYYHRKKLQKPKLLPKSNAQRSKEFRERQKAISQDNFRSSRADYMKEYRQKVKLRIQNLQLQLEQNNKQQHGNKSEETDFDSEFQPSKANNQRSANENVNDAALLPGICRACLATNVRMYHISEHELRAMYDRVTGIQINAVDNLPQQLCWECVGRLISANRFVQKALKTHWILLNEVNCGRLITETNIESIDKAQYKLTSILGTKFSNEYDFLFTEELFESKNNYKISTNKLDNLSNNEDDVDKELNAFKKEAIKTEEVEISEEQFTVPFMNVCPPDHNTDYEGVGVELKRLIASTKNANISNEVQSINIKEENKSNEKLSGVYEDKSDNVSENTGVAQNNTCNLNYAKSPHKHYICDLCDRTFHQKTTLMMHLYCHPKMHYCTHCNYRTEKIKHLESHINCKHTRNITYNCSYCSYVTFVKRNLERHAERHFKGFSCTYCSYKTYQKRTLNSHINAKHTKSEVYKCTYCSYKACYKESLKSHIYLKHVNNEVFISQK